MLANQPLYQLVNQLQHLTTRTQHLSQQARATLRQLVLAKALQLLYLQAKVLQHQ
ncbi:hypothetical protein HMPREF9422_0095 [Streptococcus cristatus ATCC 51100]|nr:hypothetical protein HMPREF9422_0095 [Streptococcus cristatus ATCC 51100]